MPASWVADEDIWKKAKKAAAESGQGENYAVITVIYKNMGGRMKKMKKASVALAYLIKAKDRIKGGLADNRPDSDFDAEALADGIQVELEHTSNRAVAKEIAKDHLTEDRNYYKKLAKIEKACQCGTPGCRECARVLKAADDFLVSLFLKAAAHAGLVQKHIINEAGKPQTVWVLPPGAEDKGGTRKPPQGDDSGAKHFDDKWAAAHEKAAKEHGKIEPGDKKKLDARTVSRWKHLIEAGVKPEAQKHFHDALAEEVSRNPAILDRIATALGLDIKNKGVKDIHEALFRRASRALVKAFESLDSETLERFDLIKAGMLMNAADRLSQLLKAKYISRKRGPHGWVYTYEIKRNGQRSADHFGTETASEDIASAKQFRVERELLAEKVFSILQKELDALESYQSYRAANGGRPHPDELKGLFVPPKDSELADEIARLKKMQAENAKILKRRDQRARTQKATDRLADLLKARKPWSKEGKTLQNVTDKIGST